MLMLTLRNYDMGLNIWHFVILYILCICSSFIVALLKKILCNCVSTFFLCKSSGAFPIQTNGIDDPGGPAPVVHHDIIHMGEICSHLKGQGRERELHRAPSKDRFTELLTGRYCLLSWKDVWALWVNEEAACDDKAVYWVLTVGWALGRPCQFSHSSYQFEVLLFLYSDEDHVVWRVKCLTQGHGACVS